MQTGQKRGIKRIILKEFLLLIKVEIVRLKVRQDGGEGKWG